MHRGDFGPKARARWVYGLTYGIYTAAGTYISVENGGAIYFTVIEGIPFPALVDFRDLGAGRWYYDGSLQAIVYEGLWNNDLAMGFYRFSGQTDNNVGLLNGFSMFGPGPMGTWPQITMWNYPQGQITWEVTNYPFDYHMGIFHSSDYPWIISAGWEVSMKSYNQIRDFGQDPNDTSPLTWDGPPPPPL